MKKHLLTLVTIAVVVLALTGVFVYGSSAAEKSGKSYLQCLDDFDWSKTCPGASCRNGKCGK